jgi:hypothetical protein
VRALLDRRLGPLGAAALYLATTAAGAAALAGWSALASEIAGVLA